MRKCNKCGVNRSISEYRKRTPKTCVYCRREIERAYIKTKMGFTSTMYQNQKMCSKHRGHPPPEYSLDELMDWLYSQPNFNDLYNNWVDSGFDRNLTPSCDRIDNSHHYTLYNIELVTWDVNNERGNESQYQSGEKPGGYSLQNGYPGNTLSKFPH